jgi:hypothetical protein
LHFVANSWGLNGRVCQHWDGFRSPNLMRIKVAIWAFFNTPG